MIDPGLTVHELIQGYRIHEERRFHCLFCSQQYQDGDIYPFEDRLVTAETAIRLHITAFHRSPFDMLIEEEKKNTGLTDSQRKLMRLFYKGLSDKEIALEMGLSPATIRYQRFHLREKAKQARYYLALFQLMEEALHQHGHSANPPTLHPGATMVDERYMITEKETQAVLKNSFVSLEPPVLKNFPVKEKKKLVVLGQIIQEFEVQRQYTEPEVNAILQSIFHDYATLRRYLIAYGFLDRTKDCKEYWVKSQP